jgi:hypothetical protein
MLSTFDCWLFTEAKDSALDKVVRPTFHLEVSVACRRPVRTDADRDNPSLVACHLGCPLEVRAKETGVINPRIRRKDNDRRIRGSTGRQERGHTPNQSRSGVAGRWLCQDPHLMVSASEVLCDRLPLVFRCEDMKHRITRELGHPLHSRSEQGLPSGKQLH